MVKKFKRLFVVMLILLIPGISYAQDIKMPKFVAHAGGGINNLIYTNSLEALDSNYKKGFRFFELDFDWTNDKELVLIHYLNKDSLREFFNAESKSCTMAEFKNFKMMNNLTQLTLQDLGRWILKHPDAYIITDIKSNNIEGLKKISRDCVNIKGHFIPQIYTYEEYGEVKKIGFENLIFTLYVMNYNDAGVIEFLRKHKISALAMHSDRAGKNFISELKNLGVFIYVHTVNDEKSKERLKDLGVDGFYTDFLKPITE